MAQGDMTASRKYGRSGKYAMLAATAGLMVGLDIGVIAGALDLITKHFNASIVAQEWIVSAMMVGAAIGALGAGQSSTKFGRKKTLIASAGIYVVACFICGGAWSVATLIFARFALGVSIGAAMYTAPLYISEISEPERRGRLISMYEIFLTTGILIAFISDTVLQPYGAWRVMLSIVALPGLVFVAASWILPETPRWLALKGRKADALTILMQLRGDRVVAEREMAEIEGTFGSQSRGFSLFRENPQFRKAVYLGIGLQVVQQLTGINIVMYYAPRIFGIIGFDETARLWGMTAVGLVNVLFASLASVLVERAGRRPLLLIGFAGMGLSLITLGVLIAQGFATPSEKIVALMAVLGFVMCFALSAGPVVWVLCSEIQPLQGRDFGVAASTFTNWAANTAVGATFLSLLAWAGPPATFYIYGICNAVFVLFTLAFVPETKGVSLEQLERRLFAGVPLRRLGLAKGAHPKETVAA